MDTSGVIAAENYEALKAMMEKQNRRSTAPIKKSKKGQLSMPREPQIPI